MMRFSLVNYDAFFFDLKLCPILLLRHGRTHTHTHHTLISNTVAGILLVLASVSSLVMLLNTFTHHPPPAGHQHPWPLCLFEKKCGTLVFSDPFSRNYTLVLVINN